MAKQNYQTVINGLIVTERLVARFEIIEPADIVKVRIKSDTAAAADAEFQVKVNGSLEQTVTIDEGETVGSETGLEIAVAEGDRVEIFSSSVPSGGIGEPLVITVVTDDGETGGTGGMPLNAVNEYSADHTLDADDMNATVVHPSSDANARTFTIDSNANYPAPVGSLVTFINESASELTISITSDTLRLAGDGDTGSRTLAQYGEATAVKRSATVWYISGIGLT